jgi:hypothetical protein
MSEIQTIRGIKKDDDTLSERTCGDNGKLNVAVNPNSG